MSGEQPTQFLDMAVERLQTVGPKRAAALQQVGVSTIGDLFYYVPRRYLDRSVVTPIKNLKLGQETTIVARVVNFGMKKGRRNRFVLVVSDDGASLLSCVWFVKFNYLQKMFKIGEWIALSGKISYYGDYQMTHPEFDRLGEEGEGEFLNTGKIIPVYPSTEKLAKAGLDSRGVRRLLTSLIKSYKDKIEETLPPELIGRLSLLPLAEAIEQVHFPTDFGVLRRATERLKFDELFFLELMIAFRKRMFSDSQGGIVFKKVGVRIKSLIDDLPFELTEAQKKVLHEIHADMKSTRPMNRLLQGDVGSGKTLVALITMLIAIENGFQAALMAPTEILAEQHYITIHALLESMGLNTVLLVGGQSKSLRERLLAEIASGEAHIVIGTHALIQEGVEFYNLGLVVIDEQHRFGVMQRALLRSKGLNPDVLVMTATPIPRTLSMTVYGDLDVSVLNELPAGRKPIKTFWRPDSKRSRIYSFVRERVAKGAQAYIVFPLVEESEKIDLKAATDSYEKMRKTFFANFSLGLIHGRMKGEEKERIMAAFKKGEIRLLVSTTVIEVGVDVPEATIMVIEHAERFGLTQLHQLRGRVGRGSKQSYCILIAYGKVGKESKMRLDTLEATTDGFKIAEVDLQLRGPGEFFGTRQHGLPDLRFADLTKDGKLLLQARKEAFDLAQSDPQLLNEQTLGTRHYFIRNYRDKYDLAWVG
ncbi:ATP-dependent DNA helicase RecG [candidate division KSB1 bacterium RBG_16_48_16]|nr:MAG: ATP-dependent DNA helicase RecG [candidate division KSB1 bacterium RBG_16_48_16]